MIAIVALAFAGRAYQREGDEAPRVRAPEIAAVETQPSPSRAAAAAPALPPIRGLPPEPVEPRAQAGAEPSTPSLGASGPPQERTAAAKQKDFAAREKLKAREKAAPKEVAAVAREEPRPAPAPEAGASSAPVMVSLAVSPWGEVHVDGKMHGVSPPLQQLELAPGRHRIEIKNSAAQPHVVTVNAKPGERIRIKHKFE